MISKQKTLDLATEARKLWGYTVTDVGNYYVSFEHPSTGEKFSLIDTENHDYNGTLKDDWIGSYGDMYVSRLDRELPPPITISSVIVDDDGITIEVALCGRSDDEKYADRGGSAVIVCLGGDYGYDEDTNPNDAPMTLMEIKEAQHD